MDLKSKKDNNIVTLILIIILLVLIIINLVLYVKGINNSSGKDNYNTSNTTVSIKKKSDSSTVPQTNDEIVKYLSTLGERDRMEYYCGRYFNHINKKEYESAYNLLYDEFKQKYFPTLEEYTTYIQKTYPQVWSLDYRDITRQGTIYVLKLEILDVLGQTGESKKSQRIVVQEKNYNDFVISFQVI